MSDGGARGNGRGQSDGPDDRRLADRLSALTRRLDAQEAAEARSEATPVQRDMRGFALAMRLSSEFVAGVIVGVGLGWFIDRFAGSSPWGLIVFTILGFVAGVYNMLRAVGALPKAGERRPSDPRE